LHVALHPDLDLTSIFNEVREFANHKPATCEVGVTKVTYVAVFPSYFSGVWRWLVLPCRQAPLILENG